VALIEHLPKPFTESGARDWIAQKHRRLDAGKGWEFAVIDVATSDAVGGVGITFRHPPGAAEPGARIVAEKRNRGFAQRATRLLCSWALTTDTGIARVQATVEPWNVASQRVLQNVGFVCEGTLRGYASYGEGRQDVLMYSLLLDDLRSQDDRAVQAE
jgi:RimJ/RimL family protein N-acetyltransferase